jgi:protoporphyrinogen oxidase
LDKPIENKRIAILGGGITGLTLCWELTRLGFAVDLFEADATVGGLAATFKWDGFNFDYGPHEFCTDNPELTSMLQEILGEDYLVRQRRSCQYFMGSELQYPFSITGLVQCLGIGFLARVGMEILAGRLKSMFWQEEDYSFRSWTYSRFGKSLYETYFGPYTEKVWGLPPELLDPRVASNRISISSVFDYLYQYVQFIFKHENYANPHSPMKSHFIYARNGMGTLCEKLAEAATRRGANIHLNSRITAMRVQDNRISSIEVNGDSFSDFDLVVNTLPLTLQLELLGFRMPKLIQFRSMAFVMLQAPIEKMRDWLWIYFPDPDVIFQRVTEFQGFNAEMCPPGSTGLCAEISYFPEQEIGRMSDEELVARTVSDLKRTGFLPPDIECRGVVRRTNYAYPIQYFGFIEWVAMMMKPLSEFENLIITGRQALYKYCNMNECMEMALDVAHAVAQGQTRFEYSAASHWKGAGKA